MAYLTPIDGALMAIFDGTVPAVNIEGVSYPVPAFISSPEEQFAKARFPAPSFGIYQFDQSHDPEREVDKGLMISDLIIPPGTLSSTNIPTVNKRNAPEKIDIMYQITTMCCYAQHDRLLQKFINTALPARGAIVIQEEGGTAVDANAQGGYYLHTFREGVQSMDRPAQAPGAAYRIFSKAYTYRILGWVDEAAKITEPVVYVPVTLQVGLPVGPTIVSL